MVPGQQPASKGAQLALTALHCLWTVPVPALPGRKTGAARAKSWKGERSIDFYSAAIVRIDARGIAFVGKVSTSKFHDISL